MISGEPIPSPLKFATVHIKWKRDTYESSRSTDLTEFKSVGFSAASLSLSMPLIIGFHHSEKVKRGLVQIYIIQYLV